MRRAEDYLSKAESFLSGNGLQQVNEHSVKAAVAGVLRHRPPSTYWVWMTCLYVSTVENVSHSAMSCITRWRIMLDGSVILNYLYYNSY